MSAAHLYELRTGALPVAATIWVKSGEEAEAVARAAREWATGRHEWLWLYWRIGGAPDPRLIVWSRYPSERPARPRPHKPTQLSLF
jgi:hypothetical protein